ncbi:hypothetical protein CYY_003593 [Polysphondylium violaceum]|uniref:DNA alkylation repair protein n=1 Tax=Polysphondylium violaceum TaxID=133409 RepID=A0A8J4Q6M8_9MYCE|nr:hypothetical protein CYY_003593 [Polysphondylium violaceum]
MNNKEYVLKLSRFFRKHHDPKQSKRMEHYMRDQFKFIGLSSPNRRTLLKQFIQENGRPQQSSQLLEIFKLEEREFKYISLDLASHQLHKVVDSNRIEIYQQMIAIEPWWDTVDIIASKLVGSHLKLFPKQIKEYTSKWNTDADIHSIWYQRTSIIFQLTYKDKIDTELLFSYIKSTMHNKEFFIQKAIGWSLRQLSKTNPTIVHEFLDQHQHILSTLAKREALRYLTKKGKLSDDEDDDDDTDDTDDE